MAAVRVYSVLQHSTFTVLDLNMHNTIYMENYLHPYHRCDCLNETRVITVCHDSGGQRAMTQ